MEHPSFRLQTVCIDCADAHVMADFYGQLLGWEPTISEPNCICSPNSTIGAPERAAGQDKMLHLDIRVGDLDSAVEHALAAGARLAEHQPREHVRVLLDPAGHPFCLFVD